MASQDDPSTERSKPAATRDADVQRVHWWRKFGPLLTLVLVISIVGEMTHRYSRPIGDHEDDRGWVPLTAARIEGRAAPYHLTLQDYVVWRRREPGAELDASGYDLWLGKRGENAQVYVVVIPGQSPGTPLDGTATALLRKAATIFENFREESRVSLRNGKDEGVLVTAHATRRGQSYGMLYGFFMDSDQPVVYLVTVGAAQEVFTRIHADLEAVVRSFEPPLEGQRIGPKL